MLEDPASNVADFFYNICIQELRRRFIPPGPLKLRYPPQWPMLYMHMESSHKIIYNDFALVGTACLPVDEAMKSMYVGESDFNSAKEHGQMVESVQVLQTTLRHPPSSSKLDWLVRKYPMPAHLWEHGIHEYLELFQHCPPETSECMLAFIYLAYQIAILHGLLGRARIGGLLSKDKETAADMSFIEEKLKEIAQLTKQSADAKERETLRQAKEAAAKAARRKQNAGLSNSISRPELPSAPSQEGIEHSLESRRRI